MRKPSDPDTKRWRVGEGGRRPSSIIGRRHRHHAKAGQYPCMKMFIDNVQGDTSGCDKPPVDFKTKVPF